MDVELRRLRGLGGVGTTWAVAWAVIGALIGLVIGVFAPEAWGWSHPAVEWALGLGAYGLVSGVWFGGLLAHHERRKSIDELSPQRAAVWGVLGAVVVPIFFLGFFDAGTSALDVLEAMAATAVLGGTFAAGSVAVARSAPRLESGEPAAARLEPSRTEELGLRARSAAPSRDSARRRDRERA